jgi:hypothetical protein
VLGFKNLLHVGHQLQAQPRELWATVVNGGQAHGPQDAIWHGRRPRDLQKVAPSGVKV